MGKIIRLEPINDTNREAVLALTVREDQEQIAEYTEKLKNARSYGEARAVSLAYQGEYKREGTMINGIYDKRWNEWLAL